ncbi:unnamed protein product [Prorocentrum cordatum]|uniref:Uncharacterized protein n=1 Tax=Prorocentrum cordatum TaxID=2364126 RepID=A0ABN9Y7Q8_9DINO|nr:unnamed protein product [Polarella glacialis]
MSSLRSQLDMVSLFSPSLIFQLLDASASDRCTSSHLECHPVFSIIHYSVFKWTLIDRGRQTSPQLFLGHVFGLYVGTGNYPSTLNLRMVSSNLVCIQTLLA